ncbi:MAG: family 20 glycosylhydrolase [Clostridia bacterium]|nr:family 20 glycosylhydrolase [Clostridia bacterium]
MKKEFMKGMLIHIGTNLWYEVGNHRGGEEKVWTSAAQNTMRFDRGVFDELIALFPSCGINTVVLDLADGIVYESHPELAIDGSLSREEVLVIIDNLRAKGIKIIPKLNFSTCHDTWLKEYSKMVSTEKYYQVCRDLIDEVCALFQPEILHLGMDEEVYENQAKYDYVVIRQNDLWWHDLYYLIDCVEKNGVRACIWSDYARHKPQEFVEKCPKSVLQCPWYYFNAFEGELSEENKIRVEPFKILAQAGFDILAGGSNEYFDENIRLLHNFCKKHIDENQYVGIIQTTWAATTEAWRKEVFGAAELMKEIK